MHFIAHIDVVPGRRVEELAPLRAAEDEAVRALVAQGLVTAPFMRGDRPGAIFLMRTDTAEVARAALDDLPGARAGIIAVTALIPLTPHAAHPDA